MLDFLARSSYQHGESIREIKKAVVATKAEVNTVSEAVKELKCLMEKVSHETFDIEKSGFKVCVESRYPICCKVDK